MNAGYGYAIIIQREQRKNELYTLYTVQELVEHCLDEENEIEVLKDRINEAIEYIEKYQETLKEHNGDWLNYQDGFKPYLLNILNGGDE